MVRDLLNINFDTYTRKARLTPTFLATLPLALAGVAWFKNELVGLGALWSLIIWGGGSALLAQVGRKFGKKKQPQLFKAWGGKPTTRMLRHRDAKNSVLLKHRHNRLQGLLPDLEFPTAEEEAAAPEVADEVYDTATTFLREKTRNREQFPLVFEENCNYGFRRNLWGMRPIGIATSAIGFGAVATPMTINRFAVDTSTLLLTVMCGLGNLLFLLGWVFWVTPAWVKVTADAYAERLLESCESI